MTRGKRAKKIPIKKSMILSVVLIATGLTIIIALLYTDVYTSYKQSILKRQWTNNSVDSSDKERRVEAGLDNLRSSGATAGNKPDDSYPGNTSSTLTGEALTSKSSPPNEKVEPVKHAPVKLGSAFARIVIPKIKVDEIVVEGVNQQQLALGPGHMEETAWPGECGNMVISGHRVTHSRPFYYLDQLKDGDLITIHTKSDKFVYSVVEKKIVKPTDLSVIAPTKDRILTLTTCNPLFSARTRLIIHAKMYD
jgi:LPXTG-site transpeptidase (sortase) family protein